MEWGLSLAMGWGGSLVGGLGGCPLVAFLALASGFFLCGSVAQLWGSTSRFCGHAFFSLFKFGVAFCLLSHKINAQFFKCFC